MSTSSATPWLSGPQRGCRDSSLLDMSLVITCLEDDLSTRELYVCCMFVCCGTWWGMLCLSWDLVLNGRGMFVCYTFVQCVVCLSVPWHLLYVCRIIEVVLYVCHITFLCVSRN